MLRISTLLSGAFLISIVAGIPTPKSLLTFTKSSMDFYDTVPETHEFVHLVARQSDYFKCETTAGSPEAGDLLGAARQVRDRTFCCQDNGGGSQCQEKSTWGTASIGMCGAAVPAICVQCSILADAAVRVVEECSWYDENVNRVKAGGYLQYARPSYRIISYHS